MTINTMSLSMFTQTQWPARWTPVLKLARSLPFCSRHMGLALADVQCVSHCIMARREAK